MKIPIALIPGLPKKELVERIHFHQRQGEVSDRALGFYLFDMEKRKMFRPYEDAAVWARKHLPQRERPDKLILLAKRLEKLTLIEAAFHSGEVPWTKIREIARIAKPDTQEVWLKAARRLTCRELEEEVRGKKPGDRPGGGLKARRTKYREELHLPSEGKAIWDKGIRKVLRELPPGSTPSDCAVELARRDLEKGPAANASGKEPQKSAVDLVVLHLGPNGESWVDSKDGRLEIDPRIIAEKILAGAKVIGVRGVEGPGVCSAIRFGERGKVASEDRDAAVSPELKEAVLARDERCLVCGTTENLSPHHLDSHADGGKSDMRRLVTLCLDRCHPAVHDHDVVLRVEEDGAVTALDRDGNVIGEPRSAAEVLAETDGNCPLETIERREPPVPEAKALAGEVAPPEVPAETECFRTLDSLDDLPPELTASQWRALEGLIEWSPTHRAFLFSSDGRDLAEFLASPGESAPTPSAEAPAGIRPGSFEDFVGQSRVVENLLLAARAAKERGEPLGHVLLSGQAGIGKTTTARLLAREYGAGLVEVLGMNVGDPHQLVSLLCRLPRFGFIDIDEIHRLEDSCQESLYTALEDGVLDVVLREGGRTRAVRVRLEPFTLVGATTRPGKLSPPLRDRFRLQERLEPYGEGELAEVVLKAAARLGTTASPEAAEEVARRSRGTPRLAIRLLERARDVAQLAATAIILVAHVGQAAERLGIDERGLDRVDREALKLLAGRRKALGIKGIAAAIGLDLETFEEVHEPWLERSGLIERTPDGRMATGKARKIYGAQFPS